MKPTLKSLGRITLILAMIAIPASLACAQDASAQNLFKSKCAMCHGPDGSGKTTMGEKLQIKDLRSEEVQKQGDEELNKTVTSGKNKMPAYSGKLTSEQITQLVGYIRELGTKK